jgi:uncharacterized membrane protein (UPF0127 family)
VSTTLRAALLALLAVLAAGCQVEAAPTEQTATVRVGSPDPLELEVEVASTTKSRQLGLMGRKDVPPGTGMAFVYETPVTHEFWMGGVTLPLSIVWSLDGTVVAVEEMAPCPAADSTCPTYSPGTTYDLAVETSGGTFSDARVRVGDPVSIELTPSTPAGDGQVLGR